MYKKEWNLDCFYKSVEDPQIEKDIAEFIEESDKYVEKYKNLSYQSSEGLLGYIQDGEELKKLIYKLFYYTMYLTSINSEDEGAIKLNGRLEDIYLTYQYKSSIFIDEIKKIGHERLLKYSEEELFKDYSNYIKKVAEEVKYVFGSETENGIKTAESYGIDTLLNIYDELSSTRKFKYRGEELTDAKISSLRLSSDEKVRYDAFKAISDRYSEKEHLITTGNIYASVIDSTIKMFKLRGIDDYMYGRNTSEEMDTEVVNTLISTVKEFYPLYHKFLKKKAEMMGKEKLNIWDVLSPLGTEEEDACSYEDGVNMYLDVIKNFDESMYEYSQELLDGGNVDVYPKTGKRGGAYCSSSYHTPTFILLNWTDKLDDVMTLAHEFGHAIHSKLSKAQKSLNSDYSLCIAETASIFNEQLMFDSIINKCSEAEQKVIIHDKLIDTFSTIFRQIQYIDFEQKCYQRVTDGETLTYHDFNKIWKETVEELYGDAVEYGDIDVSVNWTGIPHIFRSPFYCYSYSFGNILSLSLYGLYNTISKEGFIKIYKDILSSGSSVRPYELLLRHGIDIKNNTFFIKGLKVIDNMIKKL